MSKLKTPPVGGAGLSLASGRSSVKYTAPAAFWQGWQGTASMAPRIYRKPASVPDTWWKPEGGRR